MLNHRRKGSDLFMNLTAAEERQAHGTTALLALSSPCPVSPAHLLYFCGKEVGLQGIMTPQTQQYPERQYFTVWLEGGCASDHSDY